MRGKRFFEMHTRYKCWNRFIQIWNSWPSNCEGCFWSEIWQKYNPLNIIKYHYKKKSQYWMMDELVPLHHIYKKQFNGISFKLYGKIQYDNIITKPFTPYVIEKMATWVYYKNKPIYFLIDPHNRKWVLHSSTSPISSKNLHPYFIQKGTYLPYGWNYSIFYPKMNTCVNSTNGKIKAIHDNFGNRFIFSERI